MSVKGCLWCDRGSFLEPENGIAGPGQPVQCELYGKITERQECKDFKGGRILEISEEEVFRKARGEMG